MKKIYAELARIQQQLSAPKKLYNKFGNYYYRNAEGILEAVKPLLNGLALVINDEPVCVGERFYIRATVTLTDGEESVSAVAYAREDEVKKGMDGCQVTGACSSYARKYALNALLMIDDEKDSDDDELTPKNPKNMPEKNEKNEKNEQQKPQSRPENGTVKVAGTIPQAAQQAPKQAVKPAVQEPNPEPMQGEAPGAFIKRRIGEMKTQYAGFNFMEVRTALIKEGLVPDVPSATMKMEQARQLIGEVQKFYEDQRAS